MHCMEMVSALCLNAKGTAYKIHNKTKAMDNSKQIIFISHENHKTETIVQY